MISSIGASISATATAVAAGVSSYSASEIYGRAFRAMKIAEVPEAALPPLAEEVASLEGMSQRQQRMLRTIQPAITECLRGWKPDPPLPLFLSLPEFPPGLPAQMEGMLSKVLAQTKAPVDLSISRTFAIGRAGGLHAVDMAVRFLQQTDRDFALIAGVDSPFDHAWLARMDFAGRILKEGATDAFAPGEAAVCILIASERGIRNLGLKAAPWFTEPGLADEEGHRYSNKPYTGDGLASAVQIAIDHAGVEEPICRTYSTLNGENFGSKEIGVALTRNNAALADNNEIHHPADCFGDIGGAFAPGLIALAADDLACGRVKGRVLILASSDAQYRGAMILQI